MQLMDIYIQHFYLHLPIAEIINTEDLLKEEPELFPKQQKQLGKVVDLTLQY